MLTYIIIIFLLLLINYLCQKVRKNNIIINDLTFAITKLQYNSFKYIMINNEIIRTSKYLLTDINDMQEILNS